MKHKNGTQPAVIRLCTISFKLIEKGGLKSAEKYCELFFAGKRRDFEGYACVS